MTKTTRTVNYICNVCGARSSLWSGKCQQCGEWNTLELDASITKARAGKLQLYDLSQNDASTDQRMQSGIYQLDEVFGGGIVSGSVNLVSGEPGMGKSTLILQIAARLAINYDVLYVSGEESLSQVVLRAKRLGLNTNKLHIAVSNSTDDITAEIMTGKHKLIIVDSIQTISCDVVGSSAGSISQVTSSTTMLTMAAKSSDVAIIIVGQVNKEGNIAGPKLLEHTVDVVLSLEGDSTGGLKLLRVNKNRFGSTNESAIFEMRNNGLMIVDNPSAVLLEERKVTDGSIVLATIEGSRPILVEVQALVNETSYGYPKRAASGLDLSRLNLLIAVIEKRTTVKLADKDIFVNLVGGLKVSEPAADLAIVMAIASAARGKKLKDNAVVFGEVGLSGEIRHVPFIGKRINEAKSLGFNYAIGPNPHGNEEVDQYLHSCTDLRSSLNTYLK